MTRDEAWVHFTCAVYPTLTGPQSGAAETAAFLADQLLIEFDKRFPQPKKPPADPPPALGGAR